MPGLDSRQSASPRLTASSWSPSAPSALESPRRPLPQRESGGVGRRSQKRGGRIGPGRVANGGRLVEPPERRPVAFLSQARSASSSAYLNFSLGEPPMTDESATARARRPPRRGPTVIRTIIAERAWRASRAFAGSALRRRARRRAYRRPGTPPEARRQGQADGCGRALPQVASQPRQC